MMELPFEYLPYLKEVIEDPVRIVLWAVFGMPLLMIAFLPFTSLFKKSKYYKRINTVVYTSLGITWLSGFMLTLMLLSFEISGIKLYFIWFLLLLSNFLFILSNNKIILRYIEIEILKSKSAK